MTDARTTSRTGLPGDDQSSEKSLRELIARLSDGLLTANEAVRLNSLLKEDPIAQEIYLDHMLIDGLLELEFSPVIAAFSSSITESKPSASGNGYALRADRWWAPLSLRTPVLLGVMLLGAALAVGVLAGGRISLVAATPIRAESQRQSLALVDRSFESGTPPTGKAPVPSLWYGDVVEVVGPHSGITPLEGERMLRFVKSESEPNDACELYQMVDLRLMSEVIATGQVSVDASAFFNAIPRREWEDGHCFGVSLFAYSADPGQQPHVWPLRGTQPLSFSGRQEPADADAGTWQQVGIRMSLPPDTTHLLVQVSAVRLAPASNESQIGFAGHFVDQVELAVATPY